MTEIAFHFNAPDKVAYACRLLRKAVGAGARVAVIAGDDVRSRLDTALWTFSSLEFVPHCDARSASAVLQASPVVLAETAKGLYLSQVLVNLGGQVPEGFERFERVIEVVSLDDADRMDARVRWKHYADRGYGIVRHDLALKD